jgi:hypothetical protein
MDKQGNHSAKLHPPEVKAKMALNKMIRKLFIIMKLIYRFVLNLSSVCGNVKEEINYNLYSSVISHI